MQLSVQIKVSTRSSSLKIKNNRQRSHSPRQTREGSHLVSFNNTTARSKMCPFHTIHQRRVNFRQTQITTNLLDLFLHCPLPLPAAVVASTHTPEPYPGPHRATKRALCPLLDINYEELFLLDHLNDYNLHLHHINYEELLLLDHLND